MKISQHNLYKGLIAKKQFPSLFILKKEYSFPTYLNRAAMREDLPAPVRPTTPSFVRPGTVKDTSL